MVLPCSACHPEAAILKLKQQHCCSTAACVQPEVTDVLLLLQKSKHPPLM